MLAILSSFNFDAPHEILFLTDLEINFENVHLESIRSLAICDNSRIKVVHVAHGKALTQNQIQNQRQLASLFEGAVYLFHHLNHKEIPDAISKFQVKHNIMLLAMVNNKHSVFETIFFKNTIHQKGVHLNIPFLVIPNLKTKNS